jgi:sulfatase modifying factor 1
VSAGSSQLVDLPGGSFMMGCAEPPYPEDGEGPVREVELRPFALAATTVTNAEFARFVEVTGYLTDAERYGWSFVFAGLLPPGFPPTRAVAAATWWRQVEGASWRRPEGPGSTLTGREDHPVVHVSLRDASAYCSWAGVRLPSEAEWEYAARGGLEQQPYPWGNQLTPGGRHRMNVWQGSFPNSNTVEDGYLGTAPADAYPPNAFGLHNMTGNVWEWCADWFTVGTAWVLRGGSYLCHSSYCLRYRTSARMGNTPDSSSGNVGFRVAA